MSLNLFFGHFTSRSVILIFFLVSSFYSVILVCLYLRSFSSSRWNILVIFWQIKILLLGTALFFKTLLNHLSSFTYSLSLSSPFASSSIISLFHLPFVSTFCDGDPSFSGPRIKKNLQRAGERENGERAFGTSFPVFSLSFCILLSATKRGPYKRSANLNTADLV